MTRALHALPATVAATVLLAAPAAAHQGGEGERVAAVLDALHQAASDADVDRYSRLYAREAVFLGTDATERWTRQEFMAYTKARFDTGLGWTYHILERHISVAPDRATAWFDERLDNAGLGETRGSGVLVVEDGSWRIAQYSLAILIPNELARDVARQIRALNEARYPDRGKPSDARGKSISAWTKPVATTPACPSVQATRRARPLISKKCFALSGRSQHR